MHSSSCCGWTTTHPDIFEEIKAITLVEDFNTKLNTHDTTMSYAK
jgi:hypothetical protein